MYDLALSTASAGERGVSQEKLLRDLVQSIKAWTVPISRLRHVQELATLYRDISALKGHIRTHKLN